MLRSPFRVIATGGSMVADIAECERGMRLFVDPEWDVEMVALNSGASRRRRGSDIAGILQDVQTLPAGQGIYFRANPIRKDLQQSARNGDVVKRRWLYIDVDPVKAEKDNPATDAEKGRTSAICEAVHERLSGAGWPAPIIMDSGNGYALFYRCDLPTDKLTQSNYSALLKKLSDEFTGPDGIIDRKVHNLNRLVKVPGTWAKKGVQSDDRPFRPCKLIYVPETIIDVQFDLLTATAGQGPQPEPKPLLRTYSTNLSNGSASAYAKKALDSECARVVLAQHNGEGRNNALNRAAFSLGQLVAGGVLLRSEVEARLYEAACASGLDRDPGCGESGIRATIASGLSAGMESPRGIPEKKEQPKAIIGKPVEPLAPGEPLTVKLSTVTPIQVEWLIKDRIPKRFITIFAGRTGVGKSFVSHDLIARLTTGGEIPFSGGDCFKPGGALILSEDSPEYVLVPRLQEAGADTTRIHAMTWKAMANFHLGNTDMLTQAVSEIDGGVSLVMIDPPTNFLADTDEHKNSEVRQLVMKVVEWAFGQDLAVLFILHVNKQSGKGVEALNRVMGSVAWVTTARIAHTFCIDPDDHEQCLWVPLKNNLGRLGKAISYRISSTSGLAKVEWLAEVDTTAEEALGNAPKQRRDVAASEWLVERFREKLEWPSKELFNLGHEHGVSKNAIWDAKKLLNLPRAKKRTAENGDETWIWWVPANWPALSTGTVGTVGTVEPNS